MQRRTLLATAAASAVVGSLPAQAAQDTLTVAQSADAYTLDPAKHSTFPTANILFHLYDALVTQDTQGRFLPALALSWTNPVPTEWRFALRPGVRFHNGEEMTAEAVKFTFDRARDPAFKAPYASRLSAIQRVEVIDRLTVSFHTAKPYPTMLYALCEASFPALIVAPGFLQANGPEALTRRANGTGPYKLVRWTRDEQVVLEANAEYWGGAPAIKRLVFRPIAETLTRIAELRSGGVDVIGDVPPEEMAALQGAGTNVVTVDSDALFFFGLDTLNPGPLQDRRVRQALNYAIDADSIHRNILGGLGRRIAVALPTNAFGYDPTLKPYPYDPAKARALLAEAGQAAGFEVPVISRQGRYLKDREIVEAVAGYLGRVGIRAKVQFLEPGVWAQVSERKGRYGLSYGGWSGMDPDIVWFPLLGTGQYQSYFSNAELDALLAQGRGTIDPAERLAAYTKAARLIHEEAPHITLSQAPAIYALNAKLRWAPRQDSMMDFRAARFV